MFGTSNFFYMVILKFVTSHDDHDEIISLECFDELHAWRLRDMLFNCPNVVAVYTPKII